MAKLEQPSEAAHCFGRQYVAYYRVSSSGQRASGLSFAGQADTVGQYVAERGGKLVAAFSETRSGLKSAGKQLREALRTCRMRRAILIVAAIDRLSRRAALIAAIMDSDIELVVVDTPATDRVVLHVKAAWAEQESVQMSTRIKAALAEAKKRGKKLGGPPLKDMRRIAKLAQTEWQARTRERDLLIAPTLWRLRAEGRSLEAIATELNWLNIPSPQGRSWHISSVRRILIRTKSVFRSLARGFAAGPSCRTTNARLRAEKLVPLVWQLSLEGLSLPEIANELNRRGIPTTRGRKWCREKVRSVLKRGRGALGVSVKEQLALNRESRRRRSLAWAIRAAPLVCGLRFLGLSKYAIVLELRRRKIATARGGRWHVGEVQTVLESTDCRHLLPLVAAAA
jgi:DNA invertase Pin-like site-specific DNA recombinase